MKSSRPRPSASISDPLLIVQSLRQLWKDVIPPAHGDREKQKSDPASRHGLRRAESSTPDRHCRSGKPDAAIRNQVKPCDDPCRRGRAEAEPQSNLREYGRRFSELGLDVAILTACSARHKEKPRSTPKRNRRSASKGPRCDKAGAAAGPRVRAAAGSRTYTSIKARRPREPHESW